MKTFRPGKVIRRTIKIRSSDRAISDAEWVLSMSEGGLRFRRLGERKDEERHLSWRSIIGHGLIHSAK
jgi:hypothetical protein